MRTHLSGSLEGSWWLFEAVGDDAAELIAIRQIAIDADGTYGFSWECLKDEFCHQLVDSRSIKTVCSGLFTHLPLARGSAPDLAKCPPGGTSAGA